MGFKKDVERLRDWILVMSKVRGFSNRSLAMRIFFFDVLVARQVGVLAQNTTIGKVLDDMLVDFDMAWVPEARRWYELFLYKAEGKKWRAPVVSKL